MRQVRNNGDGRCNSFFLFFALRTLRWGMSFFSCEALTMVLGARASECGLKCVRACVRTWFICRPVGRLRFERRCSR